MTPSEWEVMRIIWTKRSISSLDVIEVMQRKRDWSESTIKTLLGRLVDCKINPNAVRTKKISFL
ncbi:BlaI/MecI/CopY family transcriptional regulator [Levilactobacillus brevis]|uniref:BlaI/MecI/CopY family transcriptional regulator n=1 Tax=Levilactobacillus brevis TaxID=1580 RepID=UPI0021A808E5|nr:BlaI/MecI/CopY family transcriptional regulator [Levilactobacillus brevis]